MFASLVQSLKSSHSSSDQIPDIQVISNNAQALHSLSLRFKEEIRQPEIKSLRRSSISFKRLSDSWGRGGELTKKFSALQLESKSEDTQSRLNHDLEHHLKTIAQAIAFFIEKKNVFDSHPVFNAREERKKAIFNIVEGLTTLAQCQYFTIKVSEEEIPINIALQTIRKQGWCLEFFENKQDNQQLLKQLKIFDKFGKGATLYKIATTPIPNFKKVHITNIESSPNAQTETVVLNQQLVQKVSSDSDEKGRLAYGIITPKTLYLVYHYLMDSEELFMHILRSIENPALLDSQKSTLLQFCILWLNNEEYANFLITEEILKCLKAIVSTSSQITTPLVYQFSTLLNTLVPDTLLPKEVSNLSSSSLTLTSPSTPTSKNWDLELVVPMFKEGPKEVVALYSDLVTQMALRRFMEIPIWEWIQYSEDKPQQTPALNMGIKACNSLSTFVADQIITKDIAAHGDLSTLRDRYIFFVEVAYYCYSEGDFFSAAAIQAALAQINAKLIQLQKIAPESFKRHQELSQILVPDHNFKRLRDATKPFQNGYIPHFVTIIRDFKGLKEICKPIFNRSINKFEHDALHLNQIANILAVINDLKCKLKGSLKASVSSLEKQILASPDMSEIAKELTARNKQMSPRVPLEGITMSNSDVSPLASVKEVEMLQRAASSPTVSPASSPH